jgi:hypothetical protein
LDQLFVVCARRRCTKKAAYGGTSDFILLRTDQASAKCAPHNLRRTCGGHHRRELLCVGPAVALDAKKDPIIQPAWIHLCSLRKRARLL